MKFTKRLLSLLLSLLLAFSLSGCKTFNRAGEKRTNQPEDRPGTVKNRGTKTV